MNNANPHLQFVQNTLRVQGGATRSYDLVTAVVSYLIALESYGDAQSIPELLQALATLTDMLQGPCLPNINAVLQARAVDTCKRILAWSDRDLRVSNPGAPKQYLRDFCPRPAGCGLTRIPALCSSDRAGASLGEWVARITRLSGNSTGPWWRYCAPC
jgi:hypothetical protein